MSQEIYNKTVFKRFFEKNDSRVLAWAENVFDKVANPGILPLFIKKDSEDFESYWKSVCHLFALVVLYSRQFNEIDTNKILFELFIENRGLVTDGVDSSEQMQYLFENYVEEYRKRGRLDIVAKEGVILGELLRLIQYKDTNEFIFALLMARDTGWTMGYSSPTWNRTDTVLNITKAYEKSVSVKDLSKYPLLNSTGINIVEDRDNEGNLIQAMTFVGNSRVGISSEEDMSKLIVISENLPYQISFKIKISDTSSDQQIKFGVQVYDELKRPMSCIEAYTDPNLGGKSIETNNFVKNDGNLMIPQANIYYECRATISKVNRSFSEEVQLNFLNGRGLKFQEGARYLSLELVQDRTNVEKALSNIFIYDIKIKPVYLPFYQGFLGEKNIIASFFENNSLTSNDEIKRFTETYLIACKNVLSLEEIYANELTTVVFKVFSDRKTYIEGVIISVNGMTLTTDRNGEVSVALYPGNYLIDVEKDKYNKIEDQPITVNQQDDDQLIYITLEGTLYERKITFSVIDDETGLPISQANIAFNGEFKNTTDDGTAVFLAYPGIYSYSVTKKDYYLIERSVNIEDDRLIEVRLISIPMFELTFNVKDDGNPIRDALVTVTNGKDITYSVNTNAEGQAIIDRIVEGDYSYSVEKTNYIPTKSSGTIHINEDRTFEVELNPIPTYVATIVVNDSNIITGSKTPIEGATVSFGGFVKTTNAKGQAQFTLQEGSYNYSVSYTSQYQKKEGSVVLNENKQINVDLVQGSKNLTVQVVGLNETPLAGATVTIDHYNNQEISSISPQTTGSDGRVTFQVINGTFSGKVVYTPNPDQYGEKSFTVTVSNVDKSTVVNLSLIEYAVSVSVSEERLETSGFVNSVGATVIIKNQQTEETVSQKTTGSTGRASFNLPLGSYIAKATKTNYSTESAQSSRSFDITGDSTQTTNISLQLVLKTKSFNFVVVDESGGRVPNATVYIGSTAFYANSNGEGSASNIKYGSYTVTIRATNYQDGEDSLTVNDSTQQTVTFRLQTKRSELTVSVKESSQNKAIVGARVYLYDSSGSPLQNAQTSSNGTVVFKDLKAGNYYVEASKAGYIESNRQSITLQNGEPNNTTILLNYNLINYTITVYKDGQVSTSSRISGKVILGDGSTYTTFEASSFPYTMQIPEEILLKDIISTVTDDECIPLENVGVDYLDESGQKFYLWSALKLRFSSKSSYYTINSGITYWEGTTLYVQGPNLNSSLNRDIRASFANNSQLQSIVQWPKKTTINSPSSMFKGCSGLRTIASGSPYMSGNISYMFQDCISLESISAGLLDNLTNSTDCSYAFANTKIRSVPSYFFPLFMKKHFHTFDGCSSLTSIGEGCCGRGGVDDDFTSTFRNCTSLSNVNSSPFSRSSDAYLMGFTFAGCTGLVSVTSSLVSNCRNVTSFYGFFSGCTQLSTARMSMFSNKPKLTSLQEVFYKCKQWNSNNIDAPVPSTVTNLVAAFQETGVTEISGLKPSGGFVNVTSFYCTFKGSQVSFIPAEFFANAGKCTSWYQCFANCLNLRDISSRYSTKKAGVVLVSYTARMVNWFNNTLISKASLTKVNLESMFNGCSNLKLCNSNEVVSLWESSNLDVNLNMNYMFYNCSQLVGAIDFGCLDTSTSTNYLWPVSLFKSTSGGEGATISHTQTYRGTKITAFGESGWN